MWPEFTVRLIGSTPDNGWWIPLVSALAGGVFALVGSLASTFGLEWWKGRGATRQLAIAISAEVEATARMLRFRDAVDGLRQAMEAARGGGTDVWSFEVGDDYLPISHRRWEQ